MPDPLGLEIVSLDPTGTEQDVPDTAGVAVSDNGGVIAYDTVEPVTADEPSTTRVWIRDRVGDTTRPVADLGSQTPGISANGCLVAYSVLAADGATAALTVVDRCEAAADVPLPIGTAIDTIEVVTPPDPPAPDASALPADDGSAAEDVVTPPVVAAPALSFDGSTIVWSTGREIRRYERTAATEPFVRTATIDVSTTPTPDVVTGPRVDVSADGSTIVYAAGPGTEPFAPTPANVYVWRSTTPADEPQPLSTTATGEPGTAESTSPTITGDGAFVVFESSSDDLAAATGTAAVAPFLVGVDLSAQTSRVLLDDAAQPSLSADGFHIAYRRGEAIRVLSTTDGDAVDDGPDELATADPAGPIAISQHGRWLIFASDADLLADPTAAPAPGPAPEPATAIWAADRASSSPDVVDTTTTTTTTTPTTVPVTTTPTTPTTTAPTTAPTTTAVTSSSTVPATTLPSSPVIDRFPTSPGSFPTVAVPPTLPRFTSSPSFSSSSSSTGSGVTIAPPVLTASAPPARFDPTVVNAGRRTQPVTLANSTQTTVGIISTSIQPTGPFTVLSDGCAGLRLAPAASCVVEVQFAPTAVGFASGVLTFGLDDGSVVSTTLDGEGVPEPTLDLVPEVAGAGQTVTVFGTGFPAGSTVEFTQPGDALAHAITVDPNGTFAHVVVILPNTPTGPALLAVAGQPDQFADVEAELLVSSRGATSDAAALRSGPSSASHR